MAKWSNEHNEGKNDHWFSNMAGGGEIVNGLGLGWMEVRGSGKNIHRFFFFFFLEKFSLEGNLKMAWFFCSHVYQFICLKQFLHVLVSCS